MLDEEDIEYGKKSTSFFEIVGYTIMVIFFLSLLCIPGCVVSNNKKKAYREEVINELCNKNNGKYDFCKLKSTTYYYIEKENNKK